jgi:hypothetical protein
MADDEIAGRFPAPDADQPAVADEPDPAFGEIEDDDVETPDEGEPDADAAPTQTSPDAYGEQNLDEVDVRDVPSVGGRDAGDLTDEEQRTTAYDDDGDLAAAGDPARPEAGLVPDTPDAEG